MKFKNPISDLAAQINLRKGIARSNYFAITFSGPASIQPDPVAVNALCDSVTLPGRQISTFEHGIVAIKRPYTFINDDVTLTFHVTNDFYIYGLFDKWMKHVINDVTHYIGYKDDYAMPMTISQLDLNNNEIHQMMLHKAYPISMALTPLGVGDANLSKLTVVMTYDNFTTKGSNFSWVSSFDELQAALSIPLPGISSLPFQPFGDIREQTEFDLSKVKNSIASSLDASLNATINRIKGKIQESITSITSPISSSLSLLLKGNNTGIQALAGKSQISNIFTTAITTITNRASIGLSNLIG